VEEEEHSPKDQSSEVEILSPKLSLLPRTGCSISRHLGMVSGLWAGAPLKQSTAVLATSVKSLAPVCLNAAWVLGPACCCCLSTMPRAALSSYPTVILGMVEIVLGWGCGTVSSLPFGKQLAKEIAASLSL